MNSLASTIQIPQPDLFSFTECLHFLDRGYDDCLYSIEGQTVTRAVVLEGTPVLIRVSQEGNYLLVDLLKGDAGEAMRRRAERYVCEWFDLNRNLEPFYEMLNSHAQLARMPERYQGLRLMGIPELFEALCWCVIGQQINLRFAYRLKRRLVERYGSMLEHESGRYYLFPDAARLAGLEVEELRELQFSRQKAEYIIGIAREFLQQGENVKEMLAGLADTSQMLNRLMRLRGVGEWTANYVLMKSLRRMDCITFGDAGLQSALSSLLGLNRKPVRSEVEAFFEPFRGWESYLVIYLWRTLS